MQRRSVRKNLNVKMHHRYTDKNSENRMAMNITETLPIRFV